MNKPHFRMVADDFPGLVALVTELGPAMNELQALRQQVAAVPATTLGLLALVDEAQRKLRDATSDHDAQDFDITYRLREIAGHLDLPVNADMRVDDLLTAIHKATLSALFVTAPPALNEPPAPEDMHGAADGFGGTDYPDDGDLPMF